MLDQIVRNERFSNVFQRISDAGPPTFLGEARFAFRAGCGCICLERYGFRCHYRRVGHEDKITLQLHSAGSAQGNDEDRFGNRSHAGYQKPVTGTLLEQLQAGIGDHWQVGIAQGGKAEAGGFDLNLIGNDSDLGSQGFPDAG